MSQPTRTSNHYRQLDIEELPELIGRVAELCQERKARDLLIMDLRGLSDATDFFVIASGDSEVHVHAIFEHVVQELKQEGVRAAGVEGTRAARWILIDYIDLIVHVFHPVVREFYQLERLWGDAPTLLIEGEE